MPRPRVVTLADSQQMAPSQPVHGLVRVYEFEDPSGIEPVSRANQAAAFAKSPVPHATGGSPAGATKPLPFSGRLAVSIKSGQLHWKLRAGEFAPSDGTISTSFLECERKGMALSTQHYVHLRNGRFSDDTETSAADLASALDAFFKAPPANGLALHFHGGLVSKDSAKGIAERLGKDYSEAGTWPLFFVWEAGFFETVRNNLQDIAKEEFFKELFGKVVLWALKRLGADVLGAKGPGLALVDEQKVRQETRTWLETGMSADGRPPYDDIEGNEALEPETSLAEPAAADPAIRQEVSVDPRLKTELQKIANSELPEGAVVPGAKGGTVQGSAVTLMTPEGLDKLRETPTTPGQKGLFSTAKLALTATKIVFRVVRRMRRGRGHGLYTTAVEEILRDLYLENVGKTFFWNQMKKDTADAFGGDIGLCGGTAFLVGLNERLASGKQVPRITLVGHSTGAVYICNLLAAADKLLPPAVQFDVVFLAPAVTCRLLHQTLEKYGGRVRALRSFGMSDKLESRDRLVPILYPRSLLYFVSGILEDEPDMPLAGMERFHSGQSPYTGSKMAGVDGMRAFFQADALRTVWSNVDHGNGRSSNSTKHGDFDNDDLTMASLRYLLAKGF